MTRLFLMTSLSLMTRFSLVVHFPGVQRPRLATQATTKNSTSSSTSSSGRSIIDGVCVICADRSRRKGGLDESYNVVVLEREKKAMIVRVFFFFLLFVLISPIEYYFSFFNTLPLSWVLKISSSMKSNEVKVPLELTPACLRSTYLCSRSFGSFYLWGGLPFTWVKGFFKDYF